MKQIVTRAEAQARNIKRYYTGKFCKHGHLNERYLSSGQCVECDRTRIDKDQKRKYMREYGRQKRGLPSPVYPVTDSCEICGLSTQSASLCLDHDHETGKFRGWLCNKCNRGIAFLGDDLEGLYKAIEYLKR